MFKRFLTLLFSLWCVASLTFLLMHAIPGDPFVGERAIPQEMLDSLNAYFGLDQPLWKQYIQYFTHLLQGDLGPSIVYQGKSVNDFIRSGLPVSALLGLQALLLAVPLGILIGTVSALKRGQKTDKRLMMLSTLGVSVPSFVMATLLQFFVAYKWQLLPIALWEGWSHTILPTIALSLMPTAFIARLSRSNMIEELSQDYIKTATAKGIPLFRVALRHALRNAILPVVSYLGTVSSILVTGSFMIEKIFAIPGLGGWMIHSINGRDYPMIMGFTIFFSTTLLVAMFLVDLLYRALDPRIRYG